jgi:hypothetical protein
MGTTFTAFRAMFYLLLPSETYFERLEDVPDYIVKVNQLRKKVYLLIFNYFRLFNYLLFYKY